MKFSIITPTTSSYMDINAVVRKMMIGYLKIKCHHIINKDDCSLVGDWILAVLVCFNIMIIALHLLILKENH